MRLRERIERLEATRLETPAGQAIDLPADICARVAASRASGTFPKSLADADLEAIVAAADKKRNAHD